MGVDLEAKPKEWEVVLGEDTEEAEDKKTEEAPDTPEDEPDVAKEDL